MGRGTKSWYGKDDWVWGSAQRLSWKRGVRNLSAGQNPDVDFGGKINKPAKLV